MPYGVPIGVLFIAVKEICTDGIKYSFRHDPPESRVRHVAPHSENREQIEISKYYERLPKPVLIATKEFQDGKIYYRKAE